MKRYLVLIIAVMLLGGCGKESEEAVTALLPGNIQIDVLTEETDFGGFRAGSPGEGAAAARALVESAWSEYPAGLLHQLGEIRVLLCGGLTGEGTFARGGYAGFTQRTEEGWRVVLDADACTAGTVHHEMGHILDGILTEAEKLSREDWMALCPPDFTYGAGDWEIYSDYFVDAYAMTDLKEDRASVFEAAVQGGAGVFDGKSPLWLKLHTFSQALRDHFDTHLWPAVTIWELALG